MKTWFTADWHLGEDRFQIMQRPGFKDAQDMIDHFVEQHNNLVNEDDLVYVVGDAVNQKTPEYLEQVDRFNGNKVLVRGNHDRVFTDEKLSDYFGTIVDEGDGASLSLDDLDLWITHYPSLAQNDRWNIVGHIHSAWKFQLNSINVGVDANHYRPTSMDDILFYINAITNFYDQDVWAAYGEANSIYKNSRGAKGTYWENNQCK